MTNADVHSSVIETNRRRRTKKADERSSIVVVYLVVRFAFRLNEAKNRIYHYLHLQIVWLNSLSYMSYLFVLWPSVCLSICLSLHLPVLLSVLLSVCMSIWITIEHHCLCASCLACVAYINKAERFNINLLSVHVQIIFARIDCVLNGFLNPCDSVLYGMSIGMPYLALVYLLSTKEEKGYTAICMYVRQTIQDGIEKMVKSQPSSSIPAWRFGAQCHMR